MRKRLMLYGTCATLVLGVTGWGKTEDRRSLVHEISCRATEDAIGKRLTTGTVVDLTFVRSALDLNQRKEQFSNAYVRAVASVAGFALAKPEVDNDSIDLMIAQRGGGGTIRSPRVELQLKCTEQGVFGKGKKLHFPLKIKNYDDLRVDDVLVPRILVVLYVPDNLAAWIEHTERQMLMRHCAYWVSLRGRAARPNTTRVTVQIPQAHRFDPASLSAIMARIGVGGLP